MEYRLLGPLTVVHEDRALVLGPRKQRTVLAALVLEHGRAVSTGRLIDAVWGADPPVSALGSLQVYVSNLRRVLRGGDAGGPLVRQAPGYLLQVDGDSVDLARYVSLVEGAAAAAGQGRWGEVGELAAQASGLWRGPLLADLEDGDWLRLEATRLEERRTECAELLIAALLAQGRVAEALRHTSALVAVQGLRDRACWLHAVALYQAGRGAEALDAYSAHVRRLDGELGLQPGPDLRVLQLDVLRNDAALLVWPRTAEQVALATQSVVPAPAVVPPPRRPVVPALGRIEASSGAAAALVGRDAEMSAVEAVLAEVAAGATRWTVLSGPAGIGKTRLAEEMTDRFRARRGAAVWTTCPDEAGVPAWWPLRTAVRDLGADPDELFQPPAAVDADAARFIVYERLLELLRSASAAAPLLVVIDDVQWLDRVSVRLLAYLATALRGHPVAVVLTLREGEADETVEHLLATLARNDVVTQIDVPPLDAAAVTALLTQVAEEDVAASEASVLARQTGGNPFFVTEYARLPRQERRSGAIPLAVRAVLRRRLARLGDEVVAMLRTAAVIGDVVDVQVLAAAADLSMDGLAELLEPAVTERVLVPARAGGGYAFAHGLLRQNVLVDVSPPRRQRLHARVATAMAEYPPGADAAAQQAHHLLSALPLGDPQVALDACLDAAAQAEARWDSDAAARWWEGALTAFRQVPAPARDADRGDDLLVAQVEALARSGRWETVLDVVDAGLVSAAREDRTATMGRLAAVLLRTSGAWPWASFGSDVGRVLDRLRGVLGTVDDDPAARARLLAATAVGSCYVAEVDELERMSETALALAEDLGDPDVLADALLGRVLPFVGVASHAREAVQTLDRLVTLPHREAQADEVFRHNVLTMSLLTLGDAEGAETHLRAGTAGSDALRLPVTRVQLRWAEATLAHWHGQLDRAEVLVTRAHGMHRRTELYAADLSHRTALLSLRWDRGDLSSVAHLIDASAEPLVWAAAAAAEVGDTDRATALLDQRVRPRERLFWHSLGHLTVIAHTVADVGAHHHAPLLVRLLAPHRGVVATIGQTGCGGLVAGALGRLHAMLGDVDAARAVLTEGAAIATAAGGLPSHLRIRLAAATLDPSGDQQGTELETIAHEAERIGMRRIAAGAAAAMAASQP